MMEKPIIEKTYSQVQKQTVYPEQGSNYLTSSSVIVGCTLFALVILIFLKMKK